MANSDPTRCRASTCVLPSSTSRDKIPAMRPKPNQRGESQDPYWVKRLEEPQRIRYSAQYIVKQNDTDFIRTT